MADLSADQLVGYDFDPRGVRYPYNSRVSWPVAIDQSASRSASHRSTNLKRSTSPLDGMSTTYQQPLDRQPPSLVPQWPIPQTTNDHLGYQFDNPYPPQFGGDYAIPFQSSPTDFISTQSHLDPIMQLDSSYLPLGGQMDSMSLSWQTFPNDLVNYPASHGLPDTSIPDASMPQQSLSDHSPATDSYMEVRSLTSTSSEGFAGVSYDSSFPTIESFQDAQIGAISNPGQTLHGRTFSDSSAYSDIERQSQHSYSSFEIVPNATSSPGSDSFCDIFDDRIQPNDSPILISKIAPPVRVEKSVSSQSSPILIDRSSPKHRRQSQKTTHSRPPKTVGRRPQPTPKPVLEAPGKKVGKRKGPLLPEQRKQACEIRKLGACLRCKYLKKTCGEGEPCKGCRPAHARLWQVPCTRIDIKDIAYFMKDWKADFERHATLSVSIGNIKGFGDIERTLYITHGYGHILPVKAREVFVQDDKCFGLNWVEKIKKPEDHQVNTARMSAGTEGVPPHIVSEYLDRHIEHGFESFVDNYFEGTPFLTQMIKTAYKFWLQERTPVIHKALKLLLAYNLTQHVTMVEGLPDEEGFLGKINDFNSFLRGKVAAPVMVNFQVKVAMAKMWRELQKEVLEELSRLYSSIYTREKLKHWPTIFMVASVLLCVWEEMQFDCHYRNPDQTAVHKFCHDMESTPVKVIVGLFSAISQKLPALIEWDSRQHSQLLGSNPAVCKALTEVRETVTRHEHYLRGRSKATFDRNDFDSLSNIFTSRLVIRAN